MAWEILMRINVESFFEHFDSSLREALSKALEETAPGENRRDVNKLYQAFRRHAIIDLAPWEYIPSDATEQTHMGLPPVKMSRDSESGGGR
ncbi:MAG: hypothetical protein ABI981_04140 [Betaproteobacteria bacterium]